MRRVVPATIGRLAALEPIQSCSSLLARIALSSQATTSAVPETVEALYREETGRHTCSRLRKDGRTPAIIFSLPDNESKLISISANVAANMVTHKSSILLDSTATAPRGHSSTSLPQVRQHGRMGLAAQRYIVNLGDEQLPVLPRVVHVNSVSDLVENITFMHCPPDRRINVPVPVQVIGEDACPGLKQNGFPYLIRRTVECLCPGDAIPATMEVDISGLSLGQTVLLSHLKMPSGVKLVAPHPTLPVCKIAGKGSREG